MKSILKSAVVWVLAFIMLTLMAHLLMLCALCIGIYVDGGFYKLIWFVIAFIFSLYVGNMGIYLIGRCIHKQDILGHRVLFGN